ncbi:hypothetical protein AAEO50_07135 [Rossellomorea oryzaecorticis]|uniref:Uncharacterized protein n=1 Tax=Rossellomorea oryzaecorticis TaxID=1396505 RepID=A0ABU9K7Q9_9BACI
MKYRVSKVVIVEEQNELGCIFLERLIERMLIEELGISTSLQPVIIKNMEEKE